jgi:hypothetical protein
MRYIKTDVEQHKICARSKAVDSECRLLVAEYVTKSFFVLRGWTVLVDRSHSHQHLHLEGGALRISGLRRLG